MSVKAKVNLVGLAALALVVAMIRFDHFNQGGGDRYRPPPRDRHLVFKVTTRRYLVLGRYDDPRSPTVHWTVGGALGVEAPNRSEWTRDVGKVPPGTFYALFVQPGRDAPDVVTQEVTVLWGGTVVCGPARASGDEVPRCDGYTG